MAQLGASAQNTMSEAIPTLCWACSWGFLDSLTHGRKQLRLCLLSQVLVRTPRRLTMVLMVSLCQGCRADAAGEMGVEPQSVSYGTVTQTKVTAHQVPTGRQGKVYRKRGPEHSKSQERSCNREPHPRSTEKDRAHPEKSQQPSEVSSLQRMPISSLQAP